MKGEDIERQDMTDLTKELAKAKGKRRFIVDSKDINEAQQALIKAVEESVTDMQDNPENQQATTIYVPIIRNPNEDIVKKFKARDKKHAKILAKADYANKIFEKYMQASADDRFNEGWLPSFIFKFFDFRETITSRFKEKNAAWKQYNYSQVVYKKKKAYPYGFQFNYLKMSDLLKAKQALIETNAYETDTVIFNRQNAGAYLTNFGARFNNFPEAVQYINQSPKLAEDYQDKFRFGKGNFLMTDQEGIHLSQNQGFALQASLAYITLQSFQVWDDKNEAPTPFTLQEAFDSWDEFQDEVAFGIYAIPCLNLFINNPILKNVLMHWRSRGYILMGMKPKISFKNDSYVTMNVAHIPGPGNGSTVGGIYSIAFGESLTLSGRKWDITDTFVIAVIKFIGTNTLKLNKKVDDMESKQYFDQFFYRSILEHMSATINITTNIILRCGDKSFTPYDPDKPPKRVDPLKTASSYSKAIVGITQSANGQMISLNSKLIWTNQAIIFQLSKGHHYPSLPDSEQMKSVEDLTKIYDRLNSENTADGVRYQIALYLKKFNWKDYGTLDDVKHPVLKSQLQSIKFVMNNEISVGLERKLKQVNKYTPPEINALAAFFMFPVVYEQYDDQTYFKISETRPAQRLMV